jgi:molecular chaperone IbpA
MPNDSYLLKEKIMNQLVRFDTSALNRALVGFDQIFNDFDKRFANQISTNYPPYNVVKKSEDDYEIQIAVSGFEKSEVTVEVNRDQLIIKGEHADAVVDNVEYLHRGLAARDFTRAFTLAEHMEVGDAVIRNGILTISLTRIVPEELKPRLISIKEVV